MVTPFIPVETGFFAAMILAMAILPSVCGTWWRKWYPVATVAIALPAAILIGLKAPAALIGTAHEYLSFITVLGTLYVISGGVLIDTPARGRPGSNALFLLAGAVMANVLGTTGASVLLIRPLLRANAWRTHTAHLWVFFVFVVSNIGGLLTPLGDPPLFLGFLHGVPFFWTLKLFPMWALSVGVLVGLCWLIDRHQISKETGAIAAAGRTELHGARNVVLLVCVMGTMFVPFPYRELGMGLAVVISILVTSPEIRRRNDFTYHPIIEVAVLFAGLFVTMIPVQELLHASAKPEWITSPAHLFWAAGSLSSVLDNAPTYLVFTLMASGAEVTGVTVAGIPEPLLAAISLGCVMMGAMTYIGNGPNLMVKAICEDEGRRMPSFFGYLLWSALILLPLFALITVVFL